MKGKARQGCLSAMESYCCVLWTTGEVKTQTHLEAVFYLCM